VQVLKNFFEYICAWGHSLFQQTDIIQLLVLSGLHNTEF